MLLDSGSRRRHIHSHWHATDSKSVAVSSVPCRACPRPFLLFYIGLFLTLFAQVFPLGFQLVLSTTTNINVFLQCSMLRPGTPPFGSTSTPDDGNHDQFDGPLFICAFEETPSMIKCIRSKSSTTSREGLFLLKPISHSGGNPNQRCQCDDHHLSSACLDTRGNSMADTASEETQFVPDFVEPSAGNRKGEYRSHAHPSPPRRQASKKTSKTASITRPESDCDNGNHTPGYRLFFQDKVGYQDLVYILGPVALAIVQNYSIWTYTKDLASRFRAMKEDQRAIDLLEFIDRRSCIPEFRKKLSAVLETHSDLNGFLRTSTY